ncbi:Dicer-like protein 2 [Didymella heteroderae]|uniref:Dicer-like protein 2 n=1 Tax=Didymella heteroderae TaxID=1769908 RepID=A0A9P5C5P5_9PLEO|nr:Dicer-like protein 2 [Didymella heteroderae]
MAAATEVNAVIAINTGSIDMQPFALRSYQAEMVEESLSQNVIVVMDTGSGKTHIRTDSS